MSGGSLGSQPPTASQAAQNASSSGTAGNVANMRAWQKGLLGAVSGNSAYGQNAPAIHQLLQAGMGASQQQQQMQHPAAPMMQRAATPPPQGAPGATGMAPTMPSQGPMGQMSPQMLQQLMQQNPQLAQQLMSQMGQQGGGLMGSH